MLLFAKSFLFNLCLESNAFESSWLPFTQKLFSTVYYLQILRCIYQQNMFSIFNINVESFTVKRPFQYYDNQTDIKWRLTLFPNQQA